MLDRLNKYKIQSIFYKNKTVDIVKQNNTKLKTSSAAIGD